MTNIKPWPKTAFTPNENGQPDWLFKVTLQGERGKISFNVIAHSMETARYKGAAMLARIEPVSIEQVRGAIVDYICTVDF